MSDALESVLRLHNRYNGVSKVSNNLTKTASPIRLGVLSAAAISWSAIFDPISTHPDIVLTGITARDPEKARDQVEKYKLNAPCFAGTNPENQIKVYDTYDDLISSPTIDAIYIPVPNSLHTKWTIAALEKGKHVLVEKPISSNAEEASMIEAAAEKANKVALEAFHWRFHPASHLVKSLTLNREEYGEVQSVYARMPIPGGTFNADDIRLRYDLAGGSCMDLCYVFSAVGYYACPTGTDFAASKVEIAEAEARKHPRDEKIDEKMHAKFTLTMPPKTTTGTDEVNPHTVQCEIEAELIAPKLFGLIPRYWDSSPTVVIEMSKARITFDRFPLAWLHHTITIHPKDDQGQLTTTRRTEKLYSGGPIWAEKWHDQDRSQKWWTTYRYQLEAFVDQVRRVDAGGNVNDEIVGPWVRLAESKKMMEIIDQVYEKAGLGRRGI